jgi:uncharacterized protein (TIGR03067 family)
MPRLCPKCNANLESVTVPDGKLRCPQCKALLGSGRPQADDRLYEKSGPDSHSATIESDRPPPHRTDKGRLVSRKQKPAAVPILVGLGVGFVFLLVLGVGVAAFQYFHRKETTTPVASVQTETPESSVPVVRLDPAPAKEPIQPVLPSDRGGSAKDTLPLKELKAATVYIKGETATIATRGSGFVVRVRGDTVYVATNHHVITAPNEKEPLPPFFVPRGPRIPTPRIPTPRMPRPSQLPHRRIALVGPSSSSTFELTVVFNSGTPKEQSLPADIVADDAVNDLAILEASGVSNPPLPINCQQTHELQETMSAIAFGFPFGEKLDLQKKNPAVTVTKGAISSLRGEGVQLEQVQLDLDLNPGNSGGPVVDEKGTLIGVAVAKVANTRIGFAVPVPKLQRLLQSQLNAPVVTTPPLAPARPAQPANPAHSQDVSQRELKRLKGNWQLVDAEIGGNVDERVDKKHLVIEDGIASLFYDKTKREEYKISVNPSDNTIDLTVNQGSGAGKMSLGIYRLSEEGKKLEICRGDWDNKKRPKKFSTQPGVGTGFILTVFEREEASSPSSRDPSTPIDKEAADKELKKLEGNWQMVDAEVGSNADGLVKKKRLIIEDGVATEYFERTKRDAYKLQLNPGVDPKTINLTTVAGGQRKVSLGIYRLSENGDKLEICRSNWDDKKRPKKFSTAPGVGNGFVRQVFEREKE